MNFEVLDVFQPVAVECLETRTRIVFQSRLILPRLHRTGEAAIPTVLVWSAEGAVSGPPEDRKYGPDGASVGTEYWTEFTVQARPAEYRGTAVRLPTAVEYRCRRRPLGRVRGCPAVIIRLPPARGRSAER